LTWGATTSTPQVNSLFPILPADVARSLQAWSFFWDWDAARRQVRWMTSWDTSDDDLERFVAGVTTATQSSAPEH
jgi:threonine aldolase